MSLKKRVQKGQAVSKVVSDKYYVKMNVKELGVSMKEFSKGMNIELEHFDITKGDLDKTAKITLAHLKEIPDYNTRLLTMEKKAEKALKKRKVK